MALTAANVIQNGSSGSLSTYPTASVSPVANRLYLLAVENSKASTPDIPTVTGAGMTWVQVATVLFFTIAAPTRRLTLFRAQAASPGTGALSIAFGGVAQLACNWALDEITGVITTGTNGSGAVVQAVTNHGDSSPGSASTITMAAFAASSNATYAAWAIQVNNAITQDTGYTELSDIGNAGTGHHLETEFLATGGDNTPSATYGATSRQWGGIALEITDLLPGITVQNAAHAQTATSISMAVSDPGYIHMHASGKGFVYDNGVKFIPNGPNIYLLPIRAFHDDPSTGREYLYSLGADLNDYPGVPSPAGYTFEQFFTECQVKGITSIRVFLSSEGSARSGPNHVGLEPIPLGRYWLYDVVVTGDETDFANPAHASYQAQVDGLTLITSFPNARYPNFSDADAGPVYGPKLRQSNITRMLASAEAHDVKIEITIFFNGELIRPNGFLGSQWNTINGGPCATQREFFTNVTAKIYQKRRIDFILAVWGDSKAIWAWDVCNEVEYMPGGFATDVQAERAAWAVEMADYMKAHDIHHRPVSTSGSVPNNPTNTKLSGTSHDLAFWHSYGRTLLAELKADMRELESDYGKVIHVGEYDPAGPGGIPSAEHSGLGYETGLDSTPPTEAIPYRPSLWHNWTILVGTGIAAGNRWPAYALTGLSGLDLYTQAPIYAPSAKFIAAVNWTDWDFDNSAVWDTHIAATNSDFSIGRGDGNQAMLLIHGTTTTPDLSVSNLSAGTYTVTVFDYISGEVVESASVAAVDGVVTYALDLTNANLDTLADGYDRKAFAVVLLENQSAAAPVLDVANAAHAQTADNVTLGSTIHGVLAITLDVISLVANNTPPFVPPSSLPGRTFYPARRKAR